MEGNHCYLAGNCNPPCNPVHTLPIHEYSHNEAGFSCSVTGGYVYRGNAIPGLGGTYFFADFCSNQIYSFRYTGGNVTEFTNRTAELAPGGGQSITGISGFGEDGFGELYIVDRDADDDRRGVQDHRSLRPAWTLPPTAPQALFNFTAASPESVLDRDRFRRRGDRRRRSQGGGLRCHRAPRAHPGFGRGDRRRAARSHLGWAYRGRRAEPLRDLLPAGRVERRGHDPAGEPRAVTRPGEPGGQPEGGRTQVRPPSQLSTSTMSSRTTPPSGTDGRAAASGMPLGHPPSGIAPVVEARGLEKRFRATAAVAGIDFQVEAGECFGFLGPERRRQDVHHAHDLLRLAAHRR